MWHVHVPDASAGVHPSKDKLRIIDWACDAARRVSGEVHVRDRAGQIETVHSCRQPVAGDHSPDEA
jgi:hypothetical protein